MGLSGERVGVLLIRDYLLPLGKEGVQGCHCGAGREQALNSGLRVGPRQVGTEDVVAPSPCGPDPGNS